MNTPRVIQLIRKPTPEAVGVFAIKTKKGTQHYAFKEVPCEIGGRAFALHRLGLGELYHVRIGRPTDCSCECLGFLRHGQCKHLQALAALMGHELI